MVFVFGKNKKALMPCSEKRARLLLERGRARIHRLVPFAIRLTDRKQAESALQPVRLKLDPGSRTTGAALVREGDGHSHALWLGELQHRSSAIRDALTQRRAFRRRRRSANLRYRAPRFHNRTKPSGWLAPSLQHRVDSTASLVKRLCRLAPVQGLAMELVRFDTQLLQNPEVAGTGYQQGTLAGYELREYLLEKWGRQCAYCGAENVPLQIDHVVPRSKGGSNRESNLTLACSRCNQKKGNLALEDFLKDKPHILKKVLAQAKQPLRDAAAVNSTRWGLFRTLKCLGLPLETASGGRTKWNRSGCEIPKTHALDAACVGSLGALSGWNRPVLSLRCMGRGAYKRTQLTAYGFPRGYLMRCKAVYGFQTGDLVKAIVPRGKDQGEHVGRVVVRASGYFTIQTAQGKIGSSHKYCQRQQRVDGYRYMLITKSVPSQAEGKGILGGR